MPKEMLLAPNTQSQVLNGEQCQKWSKLVAGANVTMYVGATY